LRALLSPTCGRGRMAVALLLTSCWRASPAGAGRPTLQAGPDSAPNTDRDSGGAWSRRTSAAVPRHHAPRPVPILIRSHIRGHSKTAGSSASFQSVDVPLGRARGGGRVRGGHAPGAWPVPLGSFIPPLCLCCRTVRGRGRWPFQASGCLGLPPTTPGSDFPSRDRRVSSCGLTRHRLPLGPGLSGRPQVQCLRNLSLSKTLRLFNMWYIARPNLWPRMPNALPGP
jgi:hypothetical protein